MENLGGAEKPNPKSVSLDEVDPPVLDLGTTIVGEDNSLEDHAAEPAERSLDDYSEIETVYVNQSLPDTHARAIQVISNLGWLITNSDTEQGIIDARVITALGWQVVNSEARIVNENSRLWGSSTDIEVRFRENNAEGQIAVDLRSRSRVGQSGMDDSAKHLETLVDALSQ